MFKKRFIPLALCLCLAAIVLLAARFFIVSRAQAEMKLTISPKNAITTNGGVFEGWGTSLCWWANRLGYSDTLAQQSADLFFSEEGLGMNIMRYNIGGGDDPAHKHITRTDSEVPGWLTYDQETHTTTFDPEADARQLNVLTRAVKAAGEDALVEVFSNSPPYFMTESGCSSGAVKAKDNNLREDSVEDFADYLARVAAYMKNDLALPIASLSPMNEPSSDYWSAMSWKQEGCHVDPGKAQSALIEATAKAMASYNLKDVILTASDDTSPKATFAAYRAFSENAKAAVGRINTHTYSDKSATALANLAKKENVNLWMSEVDGDGTAGTNAGEMGSALWLGKKIISDIGQLHPSAWVMWQVVDNHISTEGMNGNVDYGMVDVNKGFWGAAVADHDNETIVLTQKYYGFGQFTRYIRPGSTLITCGSEALAALNPQDGTLSIIVLNTSDQEKDVRIDLTALSSVGTQAQAVRTSGSMAQGEHWAKLGALPVENGVLCATLIPNSMTTFIVDHAAL